MRKCVCYSHNGFRLSPEGLAPREQRSKGLTAREFAAIVDTVGSVSALVEGEDVYIQDDLFIDEQYRRFHNGS